MIIDFRMRLRTEEGLKAWRPPIPEFEPYINLYKMEDRLSVQSVAETKREMLMAGIDRGVLVAGGSEEDNNYVIRQADDFFPLLTLDFSEGVERAIKKFTSRMVLETWFGVNLTPFMLKMRIDDPRLYAIYGLCYEYGLAVILHTSVHFYNKGYWLEYEDPRYLDRLCTDFPSLLVVACHGMNPQWNTALALAQRHPNLYLEVSSLPAKVLPDFVVKAMNTHLREKFVWGSNYPLLPFDSIEGYKEILQSEAQELVLGVNAERVLSRR